MKHFKNIVAAGIIAGSGALTTTSADALPFEVGGIFDISIYNYDAGGNSGDAAAVEGNINASDLVDTVTWTGTLNFEIGSHTGGALSTIKDFFDSNTLGTLTDVDAGVDLSTYTLSSGGGNSDPLGNFRETTLFDITVKSLDANNINIADIGQITNINHDDGVTLFNGSTNESNPTGGVPTSELPFSPTLTGDSKDFRLLYAAANGDPSILQVSAVPLPAAAWLLMFASGGLIAAKRRSARRAA